MKSVLLLIFFFVGCASIGNQEEDITFSDCIVIQTNDSVKTAFDETRRLFLNEGYDIDHEFTSAPSHLITTKITPRAYGASLAGTLAVKFTASIDKSATGAVINLTGQYVSDGGEYLQTGDSANTERAEKLFFASAQEIRMAGELGSAMRGSWNLMNALATKYGGTTVRYQRSIR